MSSGAITPEFQGWLQARASHIEKVLDQILPETDREPSRLHNAMRYAVLGGGKRVRACMVYAAGESVGLSETSATAQSQALDYAAAAVELIHAYSLIHDDLPCMDNDTLRRGQPTLHVQYDEALAMLVGDALQPLAFELLAAMPVAPALIVQAVKQLAQSVGSKGMVGGQVIDCDSVGAVLSASDLQRMHTMKTGALLQSSILLGATVTGASFSARQCLERYAQAVGLAFQVMDDILDVTSDTQVLGKTAGKDAANNKPTYISVLGLGASRNLLQDLAAQAQDALLPLGTAARPLSHMVDYIVQRSH